MDRRLPTARELEAIAASAPPPSPARAAPPGEAEAMLRRRGFFTTPGEQLTPFPPDFGGPAADLLAERLGHYAFRLFLRGALLAGPTFAADDATRYLTAEQCRAHADALVRMGLADPLGDGTYRLRHPSTRSFGGTLEWYVARELRLRLGFDVALDRKFRAPGVGGDLDVVAAAEGKLVQIELKSSPPKHVSMAEVAAFLDRVAALKPDVALFVVDTALRLGDRVLPMVVAALRERRADAVKPVRVERELWALGPHLYVINAKPDLMANVERAIAEGFRALAPAIC